MMTRKLFLRIKNIFLSIVFPPICIGCSTYLSNNDEQLCESCRALLVFDTALMCPICKARLSLNKRTCNHSQKSERRFPYLLGAAMRYDTVLVKNILHCYKYQKMHGLAETLADILTIYVDKLDPQPSILGVRPTVVPIPLHPKKERERGFNQSELIAKRFALKKDLPYAELLIKTRYDDPQAKTKTHQERLSRMHGAFAIPDRAQVQNKNIILIDDVSTSGATLSEATQMLKAAGARQILCLVIAKA